MAIENLLTCFAMSEEGLSATLASAVELIKGKPRENELNEVCITYGDSIDKYRLNAQLSLLQPTVEALEFDVKEFSMFDLIKFFQKLGYSRKIALSEVIKVAKVLLVIPATNAIVSERSFSAMKRVKTFLRSTTSDNRLNHLMLLHVHKEKVDNLNIIDVANEFVENSEKKINIWKIFHARFAKENKCSE